MISNGYVSICEELCRGTSVCDFVLHGLTFVTFVGQFAHKRTRRQSRYSERLPFATTNDNLRECFALDAKYVPFHGEGPPRS